MLEDFLGPVLVSQDVEGGGEGFGAVEPPGPPVVGWVGGDEVREEAFVLAADFRPGDLGDARPGAFDDGSAMGFQQGAVERGDEGFGVGAGRGGGKRPSLS